MKVKWSEVMKAADQCGFTNEDYGLIYLYSELDGTIGVEEYSVGHSIKRLLEALGVEVELDTKHSAEKI